VIKENFKAGKSKDKESGREEHGNKALGF